MSINASPETVAAVAETLKLAALLDDRITPSDKARIAAWAEQIHRHNLSRDDLLDAVQAFYDQPSAQAIGVGDLIKHARTIRRDRLNRDDDTVWANPPTPPEQPEHYPGDAKAAPDPADYPSEWTPQQRVTAYWAALRLHAQPRTEQGWRSLLTQVQAQAQNRKPTQDTCDEQASAPGSAA